jgi:hypothetical protein
MQGVVKVRITTLNQKYGTGPDPVGKSRGARPIGKLDAWERELKKGNRTMPTIEKSDERQSQALTQQEAAAILARYQELWNRAAPPDLLDDSQTISLWISPTCQQSRESVSSIRSYKPDQPAAYDH